MFGASSELASVMEFGFKNNGTLSSLAVIQNCGQTGLIRRFLGFSLRSLRRAAERSVVTSISPAFARFIADHVPTTSFSRHFYDEFTNTSNEKLDGADRTKSVMYTITTSTDVLPTTLATFLAYRELLAGCYTYSQFPIQVCFLAMVP